MNFEIESLKETDWERVAAIYAEGIATGDATFASEPPATFSDFAEGKLMACSCVARDENERVIGWGTLAKVSDRCVYAGVAEVSIYVASDRRGVGVGRALLRELIARSEAAGLWTLQAGIFPENRPSLALHEREGFRVVGKRERLGKMAVGPGAGRWRDVLLCERRSDVVGGES